MDKNNVQESSPLCPFLEENLKIKCDKFSALRTQDSTRGFERVETSYIGFSLFNTIIVDIEAAYKVTKHWRHVNIIHCFIDVPDTNVSHITLIMNIL